MYLLDTNIFRGLEAGDFPAEASEIDRRLRSGIVLPFFTCEVVINEILVILADDPVNRFDEVRSYFSWMERICGNSRVAPSATNVLRCAIHNNPELDADDQIPRLNQLRREILKARKFSELPARRQNGIRNFGPYLRDRLNKWVAEKDELCQRVRSMAESNSGRASEREFVNEILGVHLESMLSVGGQFAKHEGQTRSGDQISASLREYSHLEALIMMKALVHKNFNFAKHRNDYHDQMLCAYPAIGYVLVTRDAGIKEKLRFAGCPNPRLTDLKSALADTEARAG